MDAPTRTFFAGLARGRFEPLGLLGRGGQGVVYLCDDAALRRRVAVKLTARAESEPLEANSSYAEAWAAKRIRHPVISHVLDVGVEPTVVWIALEHVAGRALPQCQLDPAWTFRGRLGAGATVAGGLTALHAGGLIHADVKPSNIILDREARPHLIDLGFACSPGWLRAPASGTPGYVAPEVLLHGFRDERADVFGLGVTLFEIMTGRHPWFERRVDAQTATTLVCHHAPVSLATVPPLASVQCSTLAWFRLAGVLARAYAPDHARRWSSMAEFERVLFELYASG